MIYKGYKIEKTSNALWGGSPESVCWNVNKDGKNIRFGIKTEYGEVMLSEDIINAQIMDE